MKEFFAWLAAFVIVVVVMGGLAWLVQGNNFFLAQYFWPKMEAVRRDTVIESQAYSEATTRRLYDLRRQYTQAKSDDERAAIKGMALHEVNAFDHRRLPAELQLFVSQLQR